MRKADERVFAAIADPTRRELLATLADSSPKTATQLAQNFPITRQGILKHLDLLEQAGLVTTTTHGREKRYTFVPQPLDQISTWIDALSTRWDDRLQQLKNMLETDDR